MRDWEDVSGYLQSKSQWIVVLFVSLELVVVVIVIAVVIVIVVGGSY